MITSREADGSLGRLRVERTWGEILFEGEVVGFMLTLQSATLDGQDVWWPRSQEIAEAYMAESPGFRAWMERTQPA